MKRVLFCLAFAWALAACKNDDKAGNGEASDTLSPISPDTGTGTSTDTTYLNPAAAQPVDTTQRR